MPYVVKSSPVVAIPGRSSAFLVRGPTNRWSKSIADATRFGSELEARTEENHIRAQDVIRSPGGLRFAYSVVEVGEK